MSQPHFIFEVTEDNPLGDLFPSICDGCPLCLDESEEDANE